MNAVENVERGQLAKRPAIKPLNDWPAFVEDFKLRVSGAQTSEAVMSIFDEIETREDIPPKVWQECDVAASQRIEAIRMKPPPAAAAAPAPQTKDEWIELMRKTREPEALTRVSEQIKAWCERTDASDEDRAHLWNVFQSRLKLAKAQVKP